MPAKFLVAHPDHFTVRALQVALRDLRFNAREARDGLLAIDQALDEPPDAMILGVGLPGLSGLDTARALRALTPTRMIPILFITMDKGETASVQQSGLSRVDWLEAPFDLAQFGDHVQKLISAAAVMPIGRATDMERDLSAISDPLTGLYSRHYMLHRLAYESARAARYRHMIACVLLGVNQFDELLGVGGQMGADRVLVGIANLLRRRSRVVDLVGRTDTDEFLILAPHTDMEGARALAQRMRQAIEEHAFDLDGEATKLKLCVGIAVSDGTSLTDNLSLFARAESALDRARSEPAQRIQVA